MTDVPKIVCQRLQATAKAGGHPDPDLLTAFAEKSLGGRERLQVLEHLAQCSDCREAVSLAMPELEPASVVSAGHAGTPWLRWPVLRWGALAACVVVVGAAVTLRDQKHERVGTFVAARQDVPVVAKRSEVEERVSKAASDQKAAKIGPPAPLRDERDRDAAHRLARRLDQTASGNGVGAGTAGKLAQSTNERTVTSMSQMAEVVGTPAPLSKSADAEQQEKEKQDLKVYPGQASETVTVTAAAPLIEATPGKAKEGKHSLARAPSTAQSVEVTGMAAGPPKSPADDFAFSTQARNSVQLQNLVKLAPRWTLSSTGALQRSLDAGKTWETIPVGSAVGFRALSALDSEIWVGGSGGALYHSSDGGQHWVQVKPAADGKSLTADIVTVEFSDARQGKLTTASGETWVTTDAGQSWQKK